MTSSKAIELRKLGKTNIKITPIGLGTMQFAGGKTFLRVLHKPMSDNVSNKIVKVSLEKGINWFDTAEAYGSGLSESKLSKALQKAKVKNEDIIIATKWMPALRRAESIKKTINERIRYLSPFTIDLHQIHNQLSISSLEKQLNAIADLYDERKIRAIGVSNFSAKNMLKAHELLAERGLPLASNQVNYSLVNRKIESNEILSLAKELGITIIAWSPLQMGVLTGNPEVLKDKLFGRRLYLKRYLEKSTELITELKLVAEKYKVTVAQIALTWLINFHGKTVVAIPGATTIEQAKKNAEVMTIKLTKTETEKIEEISRTFLH
ncbi:MAG: aldo/keto reductase [Candidatus Heimdallarchaeaceae archaeon]